jgi:hypothetical protein
MLAGNGQGFLLCWYSVIRPLDLHMNLILKNYYYYYLFFFASFFFYYSHYFVEKLTGGGSALRFSSGLITHGRMQSSSTFFAAICSDRN